MGCGFSAADSPAATAAAEPGRSASSGAPAGEAEGDDLGWVRAESQLPVSPAHALARAGALIEANGEVPDSGAGVGIRVQIELEGGWKDCSPEETRQICQHLARGAMQFTLHARGQNYGIDFLAADGAIQTNVSTGKQRKLRILDAEETSSAPEALMKDATLTIGSGDVDGSKWLAELHAPVSPEVAKQREYGAQSRRGMASQHPFRVLEDNQHAKDCFAKFAQNEARLCGEWAVFYHSYSFAALIYEVQAAVGSVLFRFRAQYAPLPRILVNEFNEIADAPTLVRRFNEDFAKEKRDHHPAFRRVALSVMCSLASTGPEACVAMVFIAGYSCKDLSFRSVLENLLESCYVPPAKVKKLADDIIKLSEKHGLDVSQFGGRACRSGKAGHLLQVFIKRHLVDKLVYAAKPYGPVDQDRMPISKWMNSNNSFSVGQARVVAHPKYFMQANHVRMFVASADPTFHKNRQAFQKELIQLLGMILGEPNLRERAATGIYGGTLPSWWTSEDQRQRA